MDALLAAFERAGEPEPADLPSALRSLPEPGAMPSPWETWTLIGLVRRRERQLWVADVIRTRLRGTPDDLAQMGALEASDEQEKTADARAALLESGDEDAQRAVLAWEERNPHEHETGSCLDIGGRRLGPFYTSGELSMKGRAA
jgi:hypothetical protein